MLLRTKTKGFLPYPHDGYQCIPIFQAFTVIELVTQTDDHVVTHQWTILRVLN